MTLLLILSLLSPNPALAHEHYPAYICDELIVSLVEAVKLDIINEQDAKDILLDCSENASWASE